MSFIKNTAFSLRVTNHEREAVNNITGRFQEDGKDAACSAGFLCVRAEQLPLAGYAGKLNDNAWHMNAAADGAAGPIFACNTFDVNTIVDEITGAEYKVGTNTLGLPAPAGRDCTYTYIDFDSGIKQYRFGEGNLSGELGENGFATIKDGLLVPADAAPATAGEAYFKVVGSGAWTQGAYNGFGYVDVIAMRAKG